MPITVTFDLNDATHTNDRNRIRLAFQRFGWETIGGTAYRNPQLAVIPPGVPGALGWEDWFNHVIPAMMFFRSLVERKNIIVNNFTIDASASTGWRANVGPQIFQSNNLPLEATVGATLSERKLRAWLQACADATVHP